MKTLDRKSFLDMRKALEDRASKMVEIAPDVQVRVVQLSAEAGFDLLNRAENDPEEKRGLLGSLRWIAACCRDDNGVQVFTVEDLKLLPFATVQKLVTAVNEVNGIASPTAVEDAEKNSSAAGS